MLIGIVSKKDSVLYKASDIKLLIPQSLEAEELFPHQVQLQIALGDALQLQQCNIKNLVN